MPDRHPIRLAGALALAACALVAAAIVALPATASAYDEPKNALEHHTELCGRCHIGRTFGPLECNHPSCHSITPGNPDATAGKGPHGLYTSAGKRCAACHSTAHDAAGDQLLPAASVTATCFSCHDGTGGRGVFGAVKARTGVDPAGMHRIDTASVVPGGNGATGGDSTMSFKGPNGTLGCSDCHSPHDSNTVTPYRVTRWRTFYDNKNISSHPGLIFRAYSTTHLLRRNPGGSTTTATDYGSDWCRSCHAGRASGGTPHNHPVDSGVSTTTPFTYMNAAVLASDDATAVTVLGPLGVTNRGFLMPFPRTAQQGAHKPICQQCHWNALSAGELVGDGSIGDARPSQITTPDGVMATDNPRFQNFPHETVNDYLLVESGDDLCLNCHPPAGLP